ncbi:LysR family transcriptional regulator [Adlercreutzia sp. R25]|uniref:LysR family transcriptional regulator n=1 Tax=Adlercreutzia shanghongiae TaxID=3111773 RepID=UPI002DBE59DE|nr:LysR family transcriptional regulator [Adlercreutzia sp. R25]MEC4273249.1 LysR family transcriptional regulator [Adlercreutzia sp. R25]
MDVSVFNEVSTLAMCENISVAARYLNISPSVLSRHITQLEKQFGHTLFVRAQGSPVVTPTAHGEVFITAAQEIQLRLIQLSYELAHVGPDSLAVRIGTSLDKTLLAQPVFEDSKRALPEYRVSLTNLDSDASLTLLKEGDVDLACEPASNYATRVFGLHDTEVRSLFHDPLFLMVHPEDPLSSLEEVSVSQLQGFFFLHTYAKNESLMEAHLHEICNREGFEALIEILPYENSFALLHERLAPGHGAAVPRSRLAAMRADFPHARFIPLQEEWSVLDVSLFVPREATEAARTVADVLVERFGSHAAGK